MKRKITIAISAIALVALCAIGIFSFNHFSEKLDTNLIVNTQDSVGGAIRLTGRKNAAKLDAESVTITATVAPEYTMDKTLSWSMAYTESGLTYQQGTNGEYSLSDCLQMTISEDTLSVTIKYLSNFPEQVTITATSNADTSKKATCTIDCYERSTDITYSDSSVLALNSGNPDLTYEKLFVDNQTWEIFAFNGVDGVGSIETVSSVKLQIRLHDDLVSALRTAGFTVDTSYSDYQYNQAIEDFLFDKVTGASETNADFMTVLNQTYKWFTFTATLTDTHQASSKVVNTLTKDYWVGYFSISDFFSITSVTLDKSQIIF